MANRRQFVQSAAALSTISATLGVASFSIAGQSDQGLADRSRFHIDHCLLDSRFSQSVELLKTYEDKGVNVSVLDGDVTDLWYRYFSKAWKQSLMSITGVTGEDVLFVMGVLGRDQNMKLVWSELLAADYNENLVLADGSQMKLYHWLLVPRSVA